MSTTIRYGAVTDLLALPLALGEPDRPLRRELAQRTGGGGADRLQKFWNTRMRQQIIRHVADGRLFNNK
jgi:hypothetical protein